MAEASGLSLARAPTSAIRSGRRRAGTGELLRAALDAGVRDITLGIGGSATTDGGRGLLEALGARGRATTGRVDLAGLDPRLAETSTCGSPATSRTRSSGRPARRRPTGRRRARRPSEVAALDRAPGAATPTRWRPRTGRRERDTPGAGRRRRRRLRAAGAPRPVRGRSRWCPGVDLVMDAAGLRRQARAAPTSSSPARAGSTSRRRSARRRSASRGGRAAAGVPCIAVGGGVTPGGHRRRWRRSAPSSSRSPSGRRPSRRRWPRARRRSSGAASGSPGSSTLWRSASVMAPAAAGEAADDRPAAEEAPVLRSRARAARSGSSATGRGSSAYVLDGLAALYGRAGLGAPPRPDERADPHDPDPEQRRHERREGVRGASARAYPSSAAAGDPSRPAAAGAATACRPAPPPDWAAVEFAPIAELIERHPARRPRPTRRRRGSRRRSADDPRGARRLLAGVPRRACRRSRPATG